MKTFVGAFTILASLVVAANATAADLSSFVGTWRRDDGQLYRLEASGAELRGIALDPPVNAETSSRYAVSLRLAVAGERASGTATWTEPNPRGGSAGEPDAFTADATWELVVVEPGKLKGRIEWLEWADGKVKNRGFEDHTFTRANTLKLALEGKTTQDQVAELREALEAQQLKIDALEKAQLDEKKSAAAPGFDWGFKDGFYVKGEVNGTKYELRPRARLQLDYRAFPHSSLNLGFPHSIPEDAFLVRRARVGFGGNFGPFEFTLDVDPIRSPIPLGDFFFQWHSFDEVQVRFGQFKAPFDLDDSMTSDLYLDCVERPMITGSGNQLAPDYRIGVEVFGKIQGGLFNYFLSTTNLPQANAVTSGDPLFAGRLETDIGGFEAGAGALFARVGTAGPSGTGKSFTGATPGQFVFFAPIAIRGWEQAYTGDVAFSIGPWWVSGGYGWGQQERRRVAADGTNGSPLVTQGAWLTAGWMFWGPVSAGPHGLPFAGWELFTSDIKRKRNARNVGMELVCRLETIDIRDARGGRRFTNASQTVATTPSTSATALNVRGNECQALTVGLNVYPIENVKLMADYVHLRLGDETRAERAHSRLADEILVRAQLEF